MASPITSTTKLDAHLTGDKQAAIDAATAIVRDYCGWHVTPVETDDKLRAVGNGTGILQLKTLRIESVSAVTENGTALDPTTYKVDPSGYLYGRRWVPGYVYEITLTHGFADAHAVIDVVHRAAARAIASPDGLVTTARAIGQARLSYSSTDSKNFAAGPLPQADMAVLDRYRLPPLP